MDKITLRTEQGSTVEVCRHGAHVTSWKNPAGEDLIFLSKKAIFEPPKAIRGGVPICFPQFGMMGPMPTQHGFARNVAFEVESQQGDSVTMALKYDGKSQPTYPHPFELRSVVTLTEGSFLQELQVKNTGTEPMRFTCALHTYYKISSIDTVKIVGLEGTRYQDNLQSMQESVEQSAQLAFTGELDRVYCGAADVIQICDGTSGRLFEITKSGFPDAVVWNPWKEKASKMADFGDDEYKEMLCIEPAVAGSGAVTLKAGSTWNGSQLIRFRQQ